MGKPKDARLESVRKRKNFLPTSLATIILWLLTGGVIYFVDPDSFGAIPVFFIFLFFSLLFTFSILLIDKRRGLIVASSIIIFLVLGFFGVGNILNLLLITGVAISTEFYFSRK